MLSMPADPAGIPTCPKEARALLTSDLETWPSATFRENRKDPWWDVQIERSRD